MTAPTAPNNDSPFRPPQDARALWIVTITGLLLLVPVVFQGLAVPIDAATAPLLTLLAWSSFRLARDLSAPRPPLFRFFFYLYCYVWLVVAPIAQFAQRLVPFIVTPASSGIPWSRSNFRTASFVIASGVLAYELGAWYWRVRGRRPEGNSRSYRAIPQTKAWSLVLLSAGACSMTAVLLGPGVFFGSRQARSDAFALIGDDNTIISILLETSSSVPALFVLLHELALRGNVSFKTRPHNRGLIVASSLVLVIAANPTSTSRFWSGTIGLAIALVFALTRAKPTALRTTLLATLFLAIFAFPLLNVFRLEDPTLLRSENTSPLRAIVETGDYDSYAQVANAVGIPREIGYQFGRQLAGPVISWVPRKYAPWKPEDTGVRIGEIVGTQSTNLSAPLWAEVYIDFGWVGIPFVFLAVGAISARLDHALRRQRNLGVDALVLAPLAAYQLILLRGSLLQASLRLYAVVAVFFVVRRWMTNTSPTPCKTAEPTRPARVRSPTG